MLGKAFRRNCALKKAVIILLVAQDIQDHIEYVTG